ncbi:MAG TPA: integrase, partial [Syntrophomonas sp.]|nr:integrase [Syntrophomonas sp.]
EYMAAAKSANTLTAYRKDWQDFEQFCAVTGLDSLPATPDTLMAYLVALADTHKVSTLERRIASISQAHQAAGLDTPTGDMKVRVLMQGIRREKGTAPDCKAPAVTSDIKAMVSTLMDNLLGIRDRA